MATVTTQQQAGHKSAPNRTPKTGRWSSSVFKKSVMAVTGIVFLLYLIAHMVGNLKAFAGAESFNSYSEFLRDLGEPIVPRLTVLTIIRVLLLVAVAAHIWAAFSLWRQAKRARPVGYVTRKRVQQSYASRTMRWGGVILILFIIWHILDLTLGAVNPAGRDSLPYGRLVEGFSNPFVTAWYLLALVALGFHIRHGVWSATQTLGHSNKRRERALNVFAIVFAVVLIGGYMTIPLAVTFGIIA
ncbi:MAG: Succinate dehydrogenase subunit [Klenkia sp.]|nr:Succinate dehydrogenase subunit [Klenkia sp.]